MLNYQDVVTIAGKDAVFYNEPMKNHTTFKVGGMADCFVKPTDTKTVIELVNYCLTSQFPYYILGNGSNLLVSDDGYRGLIINISDSLADITVKANTITAGAGALLSRVSKEAYKNNLTGMEFAYGIPGSIGGAVTMNAGAYGGDINGIIKTATVIDNYGKIIVLNKEQLDMSYRRSIVSDMNMVVLEAEFDLDLGNSEDIKELMNEYSSRRRDKQPLEYPSAGSTFKRPEGFFAGKLIMDAGLGGYAVGGAMVSQKHCGFVINYNNATANDIYTLINDVKRIVKEKYNVILEPEVKMLGF